MYANLSRFEIEKTGSGHFEFTVSTSKRDKTEEYPIKFYLTKEEVIHALICLRGKAEFYPYYDDGIHLIKFAPSGIKHMYTVDGSKTEVDYITYPGEGLIYAIESVLIGNVDTFEIPPDEIYKVSCFYAPRIKLNLCDYDQDRIPVKTTLKRLIKDNSV